MNCDKYSSNSWYIVSIDLSCKGFCLQISLTYTAQIAMNNGRLFTYTSGGWLQNLLSTGKYHIVRFSKSWIKINFFYSDEIWCIIYSRDFNYIDSDMYISIPFFSSHLNACIVKLKHLYIVEFHIESIKFKQNETKQIRNWIWNTVRKFLR